MVEMIRASFGNEIADHASRIMGEGKPLPFLQLVQAAERAYLESLAGPLQNIGRLQTDSRLFEVMDDDKDAD